METGWLDGQAEPVAGQVRAASATWDEIAVEHRSAFEFSLREAGLPDPDVIDALQVRDDVAFGRAYLDEQIEEFFATTENRYAHTPPGVEELFDARYSAGKRLRDWFSGRQFRVDDSTQAEVRIPLFVLSAASVPGCTAAFARKETVQGQSSWDVTLFGTGLTGSSSLTVSAAVTFTAASGEGKVVFLPGSLTVERVTVLKHGRATGQGYRIDGSHFAHDSQPGLRLLPRSVVLPAGALVSKYCLAGDTTGAVAKYEYSDEQSGTAELSLGIKAFGVDLKVKGELKRSSAVQVSYELKGGFDYELLRFAEGDGFVWRTVTS